MTETQEAVETIDNFDSIRPDEARQTKHSPEPWHAYYENDEVRACIGIVSADAEGEVFGFGVGEIATMDGWFDMETRQVSKDCFISERTQANANRICICVNALAGIEHPEAFVRQAKQAESRNKRREAAQA